MTSKEFYLKTSEMAYQVPVSEKMTSDNAIVARLGPSAAASEEEARKFLEDNHFFAVDVDTEGIDLGTVEFVVEFHYGLDRYDVFGLDVCDVIDCRQAGGKLVLSVVPGSATLIHSRFPDSTDDCDGKASRPVSDSRLDILDAIDKFFEGFNFPSLAKSLKDDKDSEFFVFTYKKDPDGNVKVSKTTNDGTVEKSYKADDSGCSDAVRALKKIL